MSERSEGPIPPGHGEEAVDLQLRCPICASILDADPFTREANCEQHGLVIAVYGDREKILASHE